MIPQFCGCFDLLVYNVIIAKWQKSADGVTGFLHSSAAPMGLKLGTGIERCSCQWVKQFAVVTLKTRPSTASGSSSGELDTLWNIGQNFRLGYFFIAGERLRITPTNHISLERYSGGGYSSIQKFSFWVTWRGYDVINRFFSTLKWYSPTQERFVFFSKISNMGCPFLQKRWKSSKYGLWRHTPVTWPKMKFFLSHYIRLPNIFPTIYGLSWLFAAVRPQ